MNVTIGGTTAAARNVISGNGGYGIRLNSGTNLVASGNFIGTDVTGMGPLGNVNYGILADANGAVIGGSAPGAGNVISANAIDGISISGGVTGVVIQGNLIGTDVTGTFALGNQNRGISVFGSNAIIGGTAAGEGNVVAHSGVGGIVVLGSVAGNAIRGNSIYANGTIGIDLGSDSVTAQRRSGRRHRRQRPAELSAHYLGGAASRPRARKSWGPSTASPRPPMTSTSSRTRHAPAGRTISRKGSSTSARRPCRPTARATPTSTSRWRTRSSRTST